ncbi:hypothetical protein LAD77_00505 [Klebsiella pneumoniae]|nr:hypothetical protein [Klebsiella pneumoniae]
MPSTTPLNTSQNAEEAKPAEGSPPAERFSAIIALAKNSSSGDKFRQSGRRPEHDGERRPIKKEGTRGLGNARAQHACLLSFFSQEYDD